MGARESSLGSSPACFRGDCLGGHIRANWGQNGGAFPDGGQNCVQAVLTNGVRVFMIEDHEVPLIKASVLIPGGQRSSPPNKVRLTPRFP
jgi:hypothetical protein